MQSFVRSESIVGKRKRRLSAAEKAAKRQRRREFMTIFVGGKQKRVRRPPTIEGMSVDEFIRRNADPIWLQQSEMWELMEPPEQALSPLPPIPLQKDFERPF